MKKIPVESTARLLEGYKDHGYIKGEVVRITYEYIPTTRKEKIKKKLNDIGDEIFHLLFMIFFVPIGLIYFIIKEFIIKDLILKEDSTKQKKVDLNQSRQDKNEDDWEAW